MSSLDKISVRVESASGNIRPLLHEIRHALKRVAEGQEGTIIDLRSLPLAPGEEQRIESVLGKGEVCARVDALGPTDVQETSFPGVWLVTHKNADGEIAARFIEVTRIPDILKSQREDIDAAVRRLENDLGDGRDGTAAPRAMAAAG